MLEDLDNEEEIIKVDAEALTKSYTGAIIQQCESINSQLTEVEPDFLKLLTIQATYDAFKYHVGQINDLKTQEQIFKVIELDAKQLMFVKSPNVDVIGHS